MEAALRLRSSQRLLTALTRAETASLDPLRIQYQAAQSIRLLKVSPRRHASSTAPPSKPIVLEQPDTFRPPSHGQRLTRGRGRIGLGGAYNQTSTPREQDAQKTRKYPHMFPNEGTFSHWFLTNKAIHLWITIGVLVSLAVISLSQTFRHTSPYAHLLPPLSSIIFHPLNFVRESWSVYRLHLDYRTQQTAESRAQNILDAQKRRIFRRANGMENLDAEDDQGIDVRGIVPWDDGLTNKERQRGGRKIQVVSGRDLMEQGKPGETLEEFGKRKREEERGLQRNVVEKVEGGQGLEEEAHQRPEKKKRKVWLGIW